MSIRSWRRWAALPVAAASLALPMAFAQEKVQVQPGQPVTIAVTTQAPAPDVSINLGRRSAQVMPVRTGLAHTGGGNIDVQQPSADTLVITMTGAAVATGAPFCAADAGLHFELSQAFDVSFDKPTVKAAKLTIEGRVIGFLRSHRLGGATESGGADVSAGDGPLVTLTMPSHSVAAGENLSVNDKEGPCTVVIPAGRFCLSQTFSVRAFVPGCAAPCKTPSAEFAPDPALDPLWIGSKESFHGAVKKDLGFQVTVKVAAQDVPNGK